MHWNKFLKLIKPRETVVLRQIKTHAVAIAIGLPSILVAYWVEPMIPQDVLAFYVMILLMTMGLSL